MTTFQSSFHQCFPVVVEAYRLDRYDNIDMYPYDNLLQVVEAYRLDRYDNLLATYMS